MRIGEDVHCKTPLVFSDRGTNTSPGKSSYPWVNNVDITMLETGFSQTNMPSRAGKLYPGNINIFAACLF